MPIRPTTEPTSSSGMKTWAGPLVALAVLGGVGWYFLQPDAPVPVVTAPVATAPADVVKVPEPADILTAQQEPEDNISAQAADAGLDTTGLPAEQDVAVTTQLPELDQSDAYVQQRLLALPWKAGLASLFANEEMIRRFVVQVDNIAQGRLVPEQALLTGLPQDFKAVKKGNQYQLDVVNYTRYQRYLDLLESAPKAQVAALYQQLYPLLQLAYQELGYPEQQFDDRLQQALKVLLSAPEIADGPMLALSSVQYSFADEELEQLSMAHKQMVRLGLVNQQRLKLLLAAYQPLLKK